MIKKIILCLLILLFSSAAYAYDEKDWKRLPNNNPDFIQYFEGTFTLRVAILSSIETLRSEWFKVHGTVLDEGFYCLSVAGGGTIPEIWVQAKVVETTNQETGMKYNEVWLDIMCFGHEILHIFKDGLRVVNPDKRPEL